MAKDSELRRTVHLVSLGCARNTADSEALLGALEKAGFSPLEEPEAARFIVVNTCGFIREAVDESIDTILALAAFKGPGACERLAVAGCLVERYGRELAESLPEVDVFVGTGAMHLLPGLLAADNPPRLTAPEPFLRPLPEASAPRAATTLPTAYVKISEGCPERCTFCVIPKLKGPLKSRPMADVAAECRALARAGAAEIVLVAQESTAWGLDLAGGERLADLVSRVADECPASWIRFLYAHPARVTDELLSAVAAHKNVCPYFDVPVQHASDAVLKRMGRRGSGGGIRTLFSRIRERAPGAALRTTLLVGFPGETRRDFLELVAMVKEIRFNHLGVFVYSDAPDIPSHRLSGHVAAKTARRRREALMEIQSAISLTHNENAVGKTLTVLVTGPSSEPGFACEGRTRLQAPEVDGLTHLSGQAPPPGAFVKARVERAAPYDLFAVIEE